MREPLSIGIDVDGVLADFNTPYINLIIRMTEKDLFPARPFSIPCWSYPKHYGYSLKEEELVWDYITKSEHFWETLPAYDYSAEAIDILHGRAIRGDFVYFITSRPGVYAKQQTEEWLRKNNHLRAAGWRDFVPTVLITSDKGAAAELLDLDFYIDDKVENCNDVALMNPATATYMLNQPWNAAATINHDNLVRTDSILTFLKEL